MGGNQAHFFGDNARHGDGTMTATAGGGREIDVPSLRVSFSPDPQSISPDMMASASTSSALGTRSSLFASSASSSGRGAGLVQMQNDDRNSVAVNATTDADFEAGDASLAVEMIEYDEQQYLFDLDCVFRFISLCLLHACNQHFDFVNELLMT